MIDIKGTNVDNSGCQVLWGQGRGGNIIDLSCMASVRAGKERIAYGVSNARVERLALGSDVK